MLSANSFTSCAWHSVHFPDASFSATVTSCTLPWQEAHAVSPKSAWALVVNDFASSVWQPEHSTFAIFAGCGKSLIDVWQSVHPRTPWALAACLPGLMEISLPFSDFIPALPWQARQASSFFAGGAVLSLAAA